MTDVIVPPVAGAGHPPVVYEAEAAHGHEEHGPSGLLKWFTSTDHKVIGLSYMITSIVIFYIAGLHGPGDAGAAGLAHQLVRHLRSSSTSCSPCTAA